MVSKAFIPSQKNPLKRTPDVQNIPQNRLGQKRSWIFTHITTSFNCFPVCLGIVQLFYPLLCRKMLTKKVTFVIFSPNNNLLPTKNWQKKYLYSFAWPKYGICLTTFKQRPRNYSITHDPIHWIDSEYCEFGFAYLSNHSFEASRKLSVLAILTKRGTPHTKYEKLPKHFFFDKNS